MLPLYLIVDDAVVVVAIAVVVVVVIIVALSLLCHWQCHGIKPRFIEHRRKPSFLTDFVFEN